MFGLLFYLLYERHRHCTRYSSVRWISNMDLTPAQTTATGVRPSSVRSALMSMAKNIWSEKNVWLYCCKLEFWPKKTFGWLSLIFATHSRNMTKFIRAQHPSLTMDRSIAIGLRVYVVHCSGFWHCGQQWQLARTRPKPKTHRLFMLKTELEPIQKNP